MIEGASSTAGRSTAIVLFTDLVGSTELRSQLGDERAEEVSRKHDRLVGDAIRASGGHLLKNLGDGAMATFAAASDAVGAGVKIQQAIERHNQSSGNAVPLTVRIGLSAGDVVIEDGDCFGTPVIEAARLCAAAQGGQVLASEVVRWLTGSVGGHEFTPLGSMDLKGLPAAVPVCEVTWEPLGRSPVPLPALLTDIGRIFVGRERELERLEQLWKEAAAGEMRMALLPGEPGVGKTRLAAELAQAVHDDGATVLAGRCDEDLGVPYQPFVQALRHFVHHAPVADISGSLGRYGGELVRLLPELADQVPDLPSQLRSDPETERYRLFDAVAAWLAALSTDVPLLLVLDDLQWAAKPTLLLLRHVLRSAEPARLLILATYRDTETGRGHPLTDLLADLRRGGGTERLPLTGLDAPGVAAFLEQAAGHTLDEKGEDLAREVWAETEGNPFFVAEVLRHLFESGALERQEGRWVTTSALEQLGIPEGVREVVGRRLSRLSEIANRALTLAAVVGLEFDLRVVATAANMEEDRLLVALEEAVAARLVVEVPDSGQQNRFTHALVRAALYDELAAARRVALHRRVGEAIEVVHANRLEEHLPALAHHWARASASMPETAKAVGYTTRAGDRALAQLAHDEAAVYYAQALKLLDAAGGRANAQERVGLLISLGEAQRRAGDPAHRETLLTAARLAHQGNYPDLLALAALANTRGLLASLAGTMDSERVTSLEAALEAVGTADSTTRARLQATLALEKFWSGDDRPVRLSDDARAMARRLGEPITLAAVLLDRYLLSPSGKLGERLEDSAELVTLAEKLGDPVTITRALMIRARALSEVGDLHGANHCVALGMETANELGQPGLSWFLTLLRNGMALFTGRLQEAERLTSQILELGEAAGAPDALQWFTVHEFHLRLEQGRLGELAVSFPRFAKENPGLGFVLPMLGLLHCELGHDNEASALFGNVAVSDFARFRQDVTWLRSMTICASVCAQLGDVNRAGVLYDLLTPYANQFAVTAGVVTGCGAHFLGELATAMGRLDDGEAHFVAAEAHHERAGAPVWLARTRLEWARMLVARRSRGDDERARALLTQALAAARELRLASVERRTVELLT